MFVFVFLFFILFFLPFYFNIIPSISYIWYFNLWWYWNTVDTLRIICKYIMLLYTLYLNILSLYFFIDEKRVKIIFCQISSKSVLTEFVGWFICICTNIDKRQYVVSCLKIRCATFLARNNPNACTLLYENIVVVDMQSLYHWPLKNNTESVTHSPLGHSTAASKWLGIPGNSCWMSTG